MILKNYLDLIADINKKIADISDIITIRQEQNRVQTKQLLLWQGEWLKLRMFY